MIPTIYGLILGIAILILAIPVGNILAKATKEELAKGKKWITLLVVLSLVGGIISLVLGNDALMFTFFFIAIAASRSLKKR
jgi:hypothetical protein